MKPSEELVRYTMDYVEQRHKLTQTQAKRFILNPNLAFAVRMEQFIRSISADPNSMSAVQSRSYDAPCLKEINEHLDRFASSYASHEPEIMEYLRGLGSPLGKPVSGSGCLLVLAAFLPPIAGLAWLFL